MGESVCAWQGLHGVTWEGVRLSGKQVEMAEHRPGEPRASGLKDMDEVEALPHASREDNPLWGCRRFMQMKEEEKKTIKQTYIIIYIKT